MATKVYLTSDRGTTVKKSTGFGLGSNRNLTSSIGYTKKLAYQNPFRNRRDITYTSQAAPLPLGAPFSIPIRYTSYGLNMDTQSFKYIPRSGSYAQIIGKEDGYLDPDWRIEGGIGGSGGTPRGPTGYSRRRLPPATSTSASTQTDGIQTSTGGTQTEGGTHPDYQGAIERAAGIRIANPSHAGSPDLNGEEYFNSWLAQSGYADDRQRASYAESVGVQYDVANSSRELAVYRAGNTVLISIRGTASTGDLGTDVRLAQGNLARTNRYRRSQQEIRRLVQENPGAHFVVSGHSLGGTLAEGALVELPASAQVFTFNAGAGADALYRTSNNDPRLRQFATQGDPISALNRSPNVRIVSGSCSNNNSHSISQFTGDGVCSPTQSIFNAVTESAGKSLRMVSTEAIGATSPEMRTAQEASTVQDILNNTQSETGTQTDPLVQRILPEQPGSIPPQSTAAAAVVSESNMDPQIQTRMRMDSIRDRMRRPTGNEYVRTLTSQPRENFVQNPQLLQPEETGFNEAFVHQPSARNNQYINMPSQTAPGSATPVYRLPNPASGAVDFSSNPSGRPLRRQDLSQRRSTAARTTAPVNPLTLNPTLSSTNPIPPPPNFLTVTTPRGKKRNKPMSRLPLGSEDRPRRRLDLPARQGPSIPSRVSIPARPTSLATSVGTVAPIGGNVGNYRDTRSGSISSSSSSSSVSSGTTPQDYDAVIASINQEMAQRRLNRQRRRNPLPPRTSIPAPPSLQFTRPTAPSRMIRPAPGISPRAIGTSPSTTSTPSAPPTPAPRRPRETAQQRAVREARERLGNLNLIGRTRQTRRSQRLAKKSR